MNTIVFTWNPGLWAYDCDSDDPLGVGTKTGTYVLASEANERIKVLEDALRPMLEVCKDPKSYDLVRVSEIIRTALEVKP